MAEKLKIIPLGGLGEVGRNMTVLEYKSKILVLDCGVLFPWDEHPGVDLILPDYSYLENRSQDIEAVVVTHGHEDHIGCLPYLLRDTNESIPVVGSRFTLALCREKLKNFHIAANFTEADENTVLEFGDFKIEFIPVSHSIPDAMAVFVTTPAGTVLDTGDIKLDQTPVDGRITDLNKMAKISERGVDLLMIDSTNADVKGFVQSETEIGKTIDKYFNSVKGKIITTTFASHVHRVQQIINAAVKHGRYISFAGRSMVRNMHLAHELGLLEYNEDIVVSCKKTKDIPDDKLVYIVTGSQGEKQAVLSRIANDEHPDITLNENDLVLMTSSLIPGNERPVYKIINNCIYRGAKVVHSKLDLVHVSGHARQGELSYLYNVIRPKCVLPVHGEYRHLFANAEVAISAGVDPNNVFPVSNGTVLQLRNGSAKVADKLSLREVYVDANTVGDLGEEEIYERNVLENEGIIMTNIIISRKKQCVIGDVRTSSRGIPENDSDMYDYIGEEIKEAVEKLLRDDPQVSEAQLIRCIKRVLGPWVAKVLHRGAMLVPIVSVVD